MVSGLAAGFLLDRQWHWLRGEMDQTKRPALLALGRILSEEQTPYAIIGGLALQVHQREPRTTLAIDIAVLDREAIPRDRLRSAGVQDLLHEKLRAGSDPARRRSKRLQDLSDVQSLLEEDPDLLNDLTPEERALLAALPG